MRYNCLGVVVVGVWQCGSDGSIGGVISPSWWRDWGRHSLNTAQSSLAHSPANTRRTHRQSGHSNVMITLVPRWLCGNGGLQDYTSRTTISDHLFIVSQQSGVGGEGGTSLTWQLVMIIFVFSATIRMWSVLISSDSSDPLTNIVLPYQSWRGSVPTPF